MTVSVIIPLAKGEQAWRELVETLDLKTDDEIILAAGDQDVCIKDVPNGDYIRVVKEGEGRAGQMNAGARAARNNWLWFLHSDSRLDDDTLFKMRECVEGDKEALFFFDLKFLDDGPSSMRWNERAVQWRAGTLKLPFGDQGFLMQKDTLDALGGYREDLAFGEDHILVWKAHQEQVPVSRVGAALFTSARRYQSDGWLRTTARFVWLTLKQGFPQLILVVRARFNRLFQ